MKYPIAILTQCLPNGRAGLPLILAVLLAGTPAALPAGKQMELPPLTTVSKSPRLPGKFVWADLVTDDVTKARTFYTELFGWSFSYYGGYCIALNDSRPLCGMFQRPRPEGKPEAKPRWFGFMSVSSLERAEKAVTRGGGRVIAPPGKFPKRGEQAVFADPEGAVFGVIRSSAGDPEDFRAEPGDWIWIQLLSRDGRKAAEFYSSVGDYDVIENQAAERLNDFVLSSKGYARATIRTVAKDQERVQPNWLLFVRVKSVAESVAKTKELGGTVLLEPKAEVLQGKVAVIADPTGASIGLLEWSDELLKGGK